MTDKLITYAPPCYELSEIGPLLPGVSLIRYGTTPRGRRPADVVDLLTVDGVEVASVRHEVDAGWKAATAYRWRFFEVTNLLTGSSRGVSHGIKPVGAVARLQQAAAEPDAVRERFRRSARYRLAEKLRTCHAADRVADLTLRTPADLEAALADCGLDFTAELALARKRWQAASLELRAAADALEAIRDGWVEQTLPDYVEQQRRRCISEPDNVLARVDG